LNGCSATAWEAAAWRYEKNKKKKKKIETKRKEKKIQTKRKRKEDRKSGLNYFYFEQIILQKSNKLILLQAVMQNNQRNLFW
jgi:hypothetical protein